MKVSDWIAREVLKHTPHVFTVPGGNSMHLNASFGSESISTLTEVGAAFAADAYARIHGFGCCLTTSGPGAMNAVPGCFVSWTDRTPVLYLSGQCKTADSAMGLVRVLGNQESPICEVVKPICCFTREVRHTDWLRWCFREAFSAMKDGPAWLSIPLDVQAEDVLTAGEVAEKVKAARRPALIVGEGARGCDLTSLLPHFEVFTTRQAVDLVPGARKYGRLDKDACLNDVVLSLGARLDLPSLNYDDHFPSLIYVNHDQHECERFPSSICQDVSQFVEEMGL